MVVDGRLRQAQLNAYVLLREPVIEQPDNALIVRFIKAASDPALTVVDISSQLRQFSVAPRRACCRHHKSPWTSQNALQSWRRGQGCSQGGA